MGQTILSVDGDSAVCSRRNEALRQAGFEITETDTGSSALKLAFENQPALIILAIELLDTNGSSVCKRLKADPRTARIPVLHISERDESHRDYPESLESGADAYLREPIESPVLVAVATALITCSRNAGAKKPERDALAKDTLTALIDSIPDEVWFADAQRRFTLANAAALLEFNIGAAATTEVEDLAKRLEVYREDGSPRLLEEAPSLRALAGETVRDQEEIVRTPVHGELRYRQVSASPVRDAAGSIVGSVSVVRDITKRKQAEQALRASEQRYRNLFERMSEGFVLCEIICDEAGKPRDYRHLAVNPAFERQVGLKAADIIGPTILEVFPQAEPVWIERYGKVALTGEPARFQGRFGPRERWYEVFAFQTEPGRFGVVFTDITERKQAEAALRESEERLRTLGDNLPDGAIYRYRLDVNGEPHVDFISAGIERLTGVPVAEYMGDATMVERNIVPEDHDRLHATLALSRELLTRFDIEVRHIHRATGETRWVLMSSTPSRCPDGSTVWDGIELDITERKRAEEGLRENRAKLQAALSSMVDAVFISDAKGRFIEFNDAFATFHRFKSKEECAKTLAEYPDILDAFLPDGRLAPLEMWAVPRALRGEVVTNAEYALRRKDTGETWVGSFSFGPLRDKDGVIAGSVVVARDITDRKQAEEALRESEAQFRTLANAIPQLCWMANADGWIFWYNERWYEYTGATPEQMEGWGWQSVHDPEVLPGVVQRWKTSITTGEPFDMVFPLRGSDGVFHPFLTRVMPVHDRDGKVAHWFGTNTDISEQRQTEEALASSENRLRALLESAAQGVVAVDAGGRITLVNAKTEEMFGYTRDELLGQTMEILVPERYREAHAGHLSHFFAHPRTRAMGLPMGLDLFGRSKDGKEFPLEASLSSVEQGGSRWALALITDIEERKRAEARLLDSQKLESLGLLAGGVAHDFNNLLVGVIGNASLAQDMLPANHPAAELLAGVLKAGEQAAHLTRQMLAYSGKGRFAVEALDLSTLVPDMSGLVRPSIPKKITVRFDLDPDLPAVEADRGQVQQVFMNLALNAAEAIGSHEGLITIRTRVQDADEQYMQRHSETAALAPGMYVCLEVQDTGCGMDDATRLKIFDPFFSTKFIGRGLGLAAVAGIVRGHKGAITVSSVPGQGSCVTVMFPAVARTAGEPSSAARKVTSQGAGVILVVDDEQMVREMLKKALERHGYMVLLADSGLAAIDVLRRHPGEIALVVLDMSMPHMSGEETLPELRKIRPKVKVLVSSGYGESETMTLFRGQQVTGFIQKPYTIKGITEKVKGCLA